MIVGLNTILAEMEEIYNSVDVRVAAFRKNRQSQWQNFITVIRYSLASKQETEQFHKKLIAESVVDQFDKFMIGYKALSIEDESLDRILERQEDGTYTLKLEHTNVYYWKHEHPSNLTFNYRDRAEFLCDGWGVLHAQSNGITSGLSKWAGFMTSQQEFSTILHNEKVDAIRLRFNSTGKAIQHYLQSSWEITCRDPVTYYVCPFYAKISKPYYKDGAFYVDVERHNELSRNLFVRYSVGMADQYGNIDESKSTGDLIPLENLEKTTTFVQETVKLRDYKCDVLSQIADEVLDVSLVYPRLDGIIVQHHDRNRVRELFAGGLPQVANPLYASFKLYCSEEEFEKILLQPNEFKKTGREGEINLAKQTAFERAIAWLLELGGYRTTWLGEKDAGFEEGSADILAFNEQTKTLYVIGCTTGLPKPHEITGKAALSKQIDTKLFGWLYPAGKVYPQREITVVPVYFYAGANEKTVNKLAWENGVIAISSEIIASLYEELKEKKAIGDLKERKQSIFLDNA